MFSKEYTIIAVVMQIDYSHISLQIRKHSGKTQVFDPIRKKWYVLTPEEHVRQYLLRYLMTVMQYPPGLIAVEKSILVAGLSKRFDVVVYNRQHQPWLLAECKAPDVPVSNDTLHQLLRYNNNLQCNYWLVTNGHTSFCADACDLTNIKWRDELPGYDG